MGNGHLSERTLREYRWWVGRWQRAGEPDPAEFVASFNGASSRQNARAALLWHHRTVVRVALDIPSEPRQTHTPVCFNEAQLGLVLSGARVLHPRAHPTLDLLYTTGARISELVGVRDEDVTDTHILLRQTKRHPGGMRWERAIPLFERSKEDVETLRRLPLGRVPNLIGVRAHTVQDWCRGISKMVGLHVHCHKFRATFATHLLQRGVPIHEVRVLMGHSDIATTLRYAAVTDERLVRAVSLLR